MQPYEGGTVGVKSVKVCVAYDPENGRVHRIHRVITLDGGKEPSDREIEAHVLGSLAKHGLKAEDLRVLHVAHDAVKPRTLYTVDTSSKSLLVKKEL